MQDFISLIIYLIGILFLIGFFAITTIAMYRMVKSLLDNPTAFNDMWDNKKDNKVEYTNYEDLN
jgi:hypothetical protein